MNEWKRSLLTGTIVALASQLYWNVFVSGFRISPAVILLPILLMTIGKSISTIRITVTTAAVVFLFRLFLAASGLSSSPETAGQLATNSIFYLCYGLLFSVLVPSKPTVSYRRLFPSVFICDLLSNLLEVCIFESGRSGTLSSSMAGYLILVAAFRTLLACLFLAAESQYRTLLKKEEHENRYRRLFLMTTGLKNEIYFMKKNSEEIESVMSNAYRLYERLSAMDVPDDMKKMSLSIARDVHEIKKDYIRIIQGIEQEISEEYDEKQMSFQDLLQILEATTYHILETRPVHIRLVFQCSDNFITREHYELMAVLKNLVNNAIEALEAGARRGTIQIVEHLKDGQYEFSVSDDGPGISARHLPNIFKMGYSTKFDYKTGNIFRGVGLYGVKATVEEKFSGTISVESEPGRGTRFLIQIPAGALEEVN